MLTDQLPKMQDIDLSNKRVLIREDLNVPIQDGGITNTARLERSLPTLKAALAANGQVMVLSHLGRPQEGQFDQQFSLAPVAKALTNMLGQEVPLVKDWLNGVSIDPGQIVLCENVRFQPGEKNNDPQLAKRMAATCDVFIMDAFAAAHRAQASTTGISEYAPIACAGPLLCEELNAITSALEHPQPPVIAIIGGSKVSTKIQLLAQMLEKVNTLIIGGGMANTFLAALDLPIGKSSYEPDWITEAQRLVQLAKKMKVKIALPQDVRVANEFSPLAKAVTKTIDQITNQDLILDVGPTTANYYTQQIIGANTIIWNGPVGVFEFPEFQNGTQSIAQAIAKSTAYSIAGGGDTLAALAQFNLSDKISYLSTGGGAFLALLEGKPLPAISALIKRNKTHGQRTLIKTH